MVNTASKKKMSSNFLIESDDDLYSAVPTYTLLWQFH